MELYPAIDLSEGKVVRLLRGDYGNKTVYSENPLEIAKSFEAAGAKFLHVVDLDGAIDGTTPNFSAISEIISGTGLKVEVGGGIRNIHTVDKYILSGVDRVIIGTAAVTDPDFLDMSVKNYGEKIAVGVDMRNGFVATHGWVKTSAISGFDFCGKLEKLGVRSVIVTDISKDGAMQGINGELYRELAAMFDMKITASGGVTTIDDLIKLSGIGVYAAILGKSLYTGDIDLKAALEAVKEAEKK